MKRQFEQSGKQVQIDDIVISNQANFEVESDADWCSNSMVVELSSVESGTLKEFKECGISFRSASSKAGSIGSSSFERQNTTANRDSVYSSHRNSSSGNSIGTFNGNMSDDISVPPSTFSKLTPKAPPPTPMSVHRDSSLFVANVQSSNLHFQAVTKELLNYSNNYKTTISAPAPAPTAVTANTLSSSSSSTSVLKFVTLEDAEAALGWLRCGVDAHSHQRHRNNNYDGFNNNNINNNNSVKRTLQLQRVTSASSSSLLRQQQQLQSGGAGVGSASVGVAQNDDEDEDENEEEEDSNYSSGSIATSLFVEVSYHKFKYIGRIAI